MKNSFRVIIVALLIAAPALSFAQKAYKFGHVNKRDIMDVLPEKDSALLKLTKFENELRASLQTAQEEYAAKFQKYAEEKDKLDPLIRQTKEKELQGMQQNIQQYNDNAQQLYSQKQNELTQPIIEKIQKAINDVGKEGGFTYIFDLSASAVAFYSSDSQDVTELVKQKLNVKAPSAKPAAGSKK